MTIKKILITGADGFIGKNLIAWLNELSSIYIEKITRKDSIKDIELKVSRSDFIIHLAGVNRSSDDTKFIQSNIELTRNICDFVSNVFKNKNKKIPILFTSSIQSGNDTIYGKTKLEAENLLNNLCSKYGIKIFIMKLPNIFGKWCKPNYNSFISTFCYNIANNLEIRINDPEAKVNLVYIDEVVEKIIYAINNFDSNDNNIKKHINNFNIYSSKVGDIAEIILDFKKSRSNLTTQEVGLDLKRALYATYISYLNPNQFKYQVPEHVDNRGRFVEMLKTKSSGQFSFFTAPPNITRGGHYHHTKTEKFLVIQGKARFIFKNIDTKQKLELFVDDSNTEIVETIPGWAHDITNIGENLLIVMLWANEIFDEKSPDTYYYNLN